MTMLVKDKASLVDGARLLKKFPEMIKNASGIVAEALQNSMRAGAKNAHIDLVFTNNGKVSGKNDATHVRVTVKDDGMGCGDLWEVLTLSRTGWDDEIQENQSPAGWGVYHFFAFAETVSIHSRFGRYEIDCEKFLNDSSYRNRVFDKADDIYTDDPIDSFYISALFPIKHYSDEWEYKVSYFDTMDVYFNGTRIERFIDSAEFKDNYVKLGDYCTGSDETPVYFEPFTYACFDNLTIDYFGHVVKGRLDHAIHCFAPVRSAGVVTPVLPYRKELKSDDTTKAFTTWVENKVKDYYKSFVNSMVCGEASVSITEKYNFLERTFSDLLAGDDIDKCIVYAHENKTWHTGWLCGKKKIIVSRDDVVDFCIKLKDCHGNMATSVVDADEPIYFASTSTPDWVRFKTEIELPDLDTSDGDQVEYYDLYVRLDYEDDIGLLREIGAKGMSYENNGNIFVITTREYICSAHGLFEPYFEDYFYNDSSDSDSYETQEDWYETAYMHYIDSFLKPSFPDMRDLILRSLIRDCQNHKMVRFTSSESSKIDRGNVRVTFDMDKKVVEFDFGKTKKTITF